LAAAAAVELLYLVDCWLCLYKKYNDNDITTTQRIRKQNQHKIMIGKKPTLLYNQNNGFKA